MPPRLHLAQRLQHQRMLHFFERFLPERQGGMIPRLIDGPHHQRAGQERLGRRPLRRTRA